MSARTISREEAAALLNGGRMVNEHGVHTMRSLAQTVIDTHDRADAAEADVARLTMELTGARKLANESQAARIRQSLELADALARIAELEALAAGPRSLVDDAACAAIDGGAK